MKKIICVIIISFFIIFNGCIEKKVQISNPQDNYIIYNIGQYPEDLLMFKMKSNRQEDMLNMLFEGLVKLDVNGNIVPAIAEKWEISSDGITYTFHLRENAKWNDGSDINAENFVTFFSEILSKSMENDFAYQLSSIYGVDEYRVKNTSFKDVAINAMDRKVLQIRLNHQNPELLKILSQPVFSLRGNIDALKDWKKRYGEIKFSGPYMIKEIKDKDRIIIKKNINYWNSESVKENSIMITSSPNSECALADFETFKINIMKEPPLSEVNRLAGDKNTLVVYTNNTIGVAFNFKGKDIVKDINFRKALYQVLDPAEIADNALSEFNVFVNSDSFSGTKNVFKDNAYNADRKKQTGRDYIKKVPENQLTTIKMVGLNTDKNKRLGKTIAEAAKKNLDLNIQWKLYDESELKNIIDKKDFDLILNKYEQPYKSDVLWLQNWANNSIKNVGGYYNKSLNEFIDKITMERDNEKRKKYIEEGKRILQEDIPVIPLFYDVNIILKSKDIQGLKVNKDGTLDFKNVYKYMNEFEQ